SAVLAGEAIATVRDGVDLTTYPARPARSARNAPACRTPPPPRLDSAHLGSTAFLHISAAWACARTRWDLTICSGVSRSGVDAGAIAAACPPPLLLEHPASQVHEGPRGVQHALRHPPHLPAECRQAHHHRGVGISSVPLQVVSTVVLQPHLPAPVAQVQPRDQSTELVAHLYL